MQGGGDVLHQAQRGERQAPRAEAEQQQHPGGENRAGEDQQEGLPARLQEGAAACRLEPDGGRQTERGDHGGFQKQPGLAVHVQLLADQRIEGKRGRQEQADHGQAFRGDQRDQNPDQGQAHGDPLRAAQPLAQKDHAQRHIDQRPHEIAKARLQHVSVGHRPDERAPVGGNQDGPDGRPFHAAQGKQRRDAGRLDQHERGKRDRRPKGAMGDDFYRRAGIKRPVERRDSPDRVGQERIDQTCAEFGRIGGGGRGFHSALI